MLSCFVHLINVESNHPMIKLSTLLIIITSLEGCAQIMDHNNPDEPHVYFQDASSCNESSQQFQSMNVPNGMSQTTIQIPLGLDKNKYIECMKVKGWTKLPTKTFEVENLDSHCNKLNQETPESPKSHAECLDHNQLNIEVLPNQ